MKLLLALCAFLANVMFVHAETWNVGGKLDTYRIQWLKGRHQIKARLVQGGAWETTCGEVIVSENRDFNIVCDKPWFSDQAHLYFFHRLFYGEQCRMSRFADIDPHTVGDEWEISEYDEGEANDDECPHEVY